MRYDTMLANTRPSSMQLSIVMNSFRTYVCELAEIRLLTESVDNLPFQHCFIDTNAELTEKSDRPIVLIAFFIPSPPPTIAPMCRVVFIHSIREIFNIQLKHSII
ncbi:unnamed protein product [Umbelopsis ramanniana]